MKSGGKQATKLGGETWERGYIMAVYFSLCSLQMQMQCLTYQ